MLIVYCHTYTVSVMTTNCRDPNPNPNPIPNPKPNAIPKSYPISQVI